MIASQQRRASRALLGIDQHEDLPPGVEVFRITGPFFFGVAGERLDTLRRLGQSPCVIILRMRRVPLLDLSGAQVLEEFVEQARISGARVIFSGARPQPCSMFERVGLGRESTEISYANDYAHVQSIAVALIEKAAAPA